MWNKLTILRQEYLDRGIMDSMDYEKFCMISIVYHSTRIEGCSLSETDTRVLLEKNITAHGKPLTDHLMVKDHFEAFKLIKKMAGDKRKISLDLMKEVNAAVMKSTGGIVNSMAGNFNTSQGDLRLAQVYVDQKYFPDYSKVPGLLSLLTDEINARIDQVTDIEVLKLAADLHYNFVNIHPFGDGNGRTARLMMNYIQLYHHEPLIKIFTEDRAEYINALNETEAKNDPEIFRSFICRQQIKFLELELEKFQKGMAGFGLLF